ncbi:MAG: HAD-IA family hydrolase [Acidobacteria bacterium]|nr:HAD-IA family hydrolase [Acidobacteriota bacterium]
MIDYEQFAFIFDMDGTLVDNMRFHMRAWEVMLRENGIKARAEDFLVNTAGKTNREIVPTIFPEASPAEVLGLADRKEEIYRESYLPERAPLAGATAFLQESRRLGIGLAVATAAPPANVEFVLGGLGLGRFFDAVTNSSEVSMGKPDPEIFLKTAEKLQKNPATCIVFEDALNGFEAAARAGMRSIGIATLNPVGVILEQPSVIAAFENFLNLKPQEIIGTGILEDVVTEFRTV